MQVSYDNNYAMLAATHILNLHGAPCTVVVVPQMLQVLDHLPLTTRNQLEENKLLPVVRKWRERPPTKTRQEHCPKVI